MMDYVYAVTCYLFGQNLIMHYFILLTSYLTSIVFINHYQHKGTILYNI